MHRIWDTTPGPDRERPGAHVSQVARRVEPRLPLEHRVLAVVGADLGAYADVARRVRVISRKRGRKS
jgi:hypothetical protein